MNDSELIDFAVKAGYHKGVALHDINQLRNFMELVSSSEREACAKLADVYRIGCGSKAFRLLGNEIRKRGEK